MKLGTVDTDRHVLIVAEIGNNHEGDFALAKEMVGLAAESGVDAVKFQTIRARTIIKKSDQARFERIKSFELSDEQFVALAQRARECGIMFLSTPFELDAVKLLDTLCPAFKIASSDCTFDPLLDEIARCAKPVLLSTGTATAAEIAYAKVRFEKLWTQRGVQPGLALLHCVSAYPTTPEEANLLAIKSLRKQFDCDVGYSDHTLGIDAAILSVALGGRMIEKHFTIDKNYSDFHDHQVSADPAEMKELVRRVRQAELMLGDGVIAVRSVAEAFAATSRRRIVASKTIEAGTAIRWDHLNWVRSTEGLAAGEESQLLGRQPTERVEEGKVIFLERTV